MPKAYRVGSRLEPASHRVVALEARRPCFCLALSCTVTLILATVFAVSAWNLHQHQFNKDMLYFHARDELAVSEVCKDFSTIFCDVYEISLWERADVYVLPEKAKVNKSDVVTESLVMGEVPTRAEDTRAFYLLEGSSIVIDACRENSSTPEKADICIIKGNNAYRRYHEGHWQHLCHVYRVIGQKNQCDDDVSSDHPVHINITVKESDTFFVVFTHGRWRSLEEENRRRPDGLGISINGTVTRTKYDTRHSEIVCHASEKDSCSINLPWASDRDIVLQLSEHNVREGYNVQTSFVTRCHLRLAFWIGLFGGVPLVVSAGAWIFFGCLFCRKRRRNMAAVQRSAKRKAKKNRSKEDKDGLVHNEVLPPDGGMMAIQDE